MTEEFKSNEDVLHDMKTQIATYKEMGIHAAALRLEGQLDFIEQNLFKSIQKKLEKLTSQPVKFESRLNRAMGELRNVERNSCILDVSSAGPTSVEDQLQHCLVRRLVFILHKTRFIFSFYFHRKSIEPCQK